MRRVAECGLAAATRPITMTRLSSDGDGESDGEGEQVKRGMKTNSGLKAPELD